MTTLAFANYTLDQLENSVISYANSVNASEYQFLVALREFDLRQGWRRWLCSDCASWMNLKCKVAPATAREKLRTAIALINLPLISAAFEAGDLSYSNVRSMTRVANPDNEKVLCDFAVGATASQVEQYCRRTRNGQRVESSADANRNHRSRWLSRSYRSDGTMTMSVELCRETGELVMAAIDAAMSMEVANCDESVFARQADALVEIARTFLTEGETDEGTAKKKALGEHYQVMVHVDESALKDKGGESDLPLETVRRIACDGQVKEIIEDESGTPLDMGRKRRTVTPALKAALIARDRRCRFPGCTHDKWLDAHHVKHWADGGETTLENTILICSSHHRDLHEGGFEIKRDFKGDWYFIRPDGKPLPQGASVPANYSEDVSRDGCLDDQISEPACVYLVANNNTSGLLAIP